ncbi:hypothetical protein SeLEV6574_g04227 [Synchytrium endobioticum]|uniref:Uncharacterized protein n=1 Tax=Synchytrium endobioticum TaxID=286115 RepID=A0A507D0C3_9FUNG|nr:hypothetical protein SeLEV6574_g04227 [Synchytrium endobioticum]
MHQKKKGSTWESRRCRNSLAAETRARAKNAEQIKNLEEKARALQTEIDVLEYKLHLLQHDRVNWADRLTDLTNHASSLDGRLRDAQALANSLQSR